MSTIHITQQINVHERTTKIIEPSNIKGKQLVRAINSILWSKEISKQKKDICISLVSKVWYIANLGEWHIQPRNKLIALKHQKYNFVGKLIYKEWQKIGSLNMCKTGYSRRIREGNSKTTWVEGNKKQSSKKSTTMSLTGQEQLKLTSNFIHYIALYRSSFLLKYLQLRLGFNSISSTSWSKLVKGEKEYYTNFSGMNIWNFQLLFPQKFKSTYFLKIYFYLNYEEV